MLRRTIKHGGHPAPGILECGGIIGYGVGQKGERNETDYRSCLFYPGTGRHDP